VEQLVNEESDTKEEMYENAVPPNLDKPMQWLYYQQKYALFLLLLFGVLVFIWTKRKDSLNVLIIIFVVFGLLLASANDYYTIGYVLYRYAMSIYIEPFEYLKMSRKELKQHVKNQKNDAKSKRKIPRKKT